MIFRLDEDVITVLWFALSSLVNLNKLPENVNESQNDHLDDGETM